MNWLEGVELKPALQLEVVEAEFDFTYSDAYLGNSNNWALFLHIDGSVQQVDWLEVTPFELNRFESESIEDNN